MSRKILYVVTIAPTLRVLMRGQISWMQNKGFEVHTASTGQIDPQDGESFNQKHHEVNMTREISPFRDALSAFNLARVISSVRPDVIVASTPKAAFLCLLVARILRVPKRVYLLRGLRLATETGLKRRLLAFMEKRAAANCDVVIAVSASVGMEFEKLGLSPKEKIRFVGSGSSNGVDSNRFLPLTPAQRESARANIGILPDEIVVGFVGRLVEDKGFSVFCEALTQICATDQKVVPIVFGSNEEDLIIPDSIRFMGVKDNLENWYPLFDILVLPTFREGFPNVVIEAGACEVPTVTTRATGSVDSVVDGVTGLLVDVNNVAQTREAIRTLISDPQRRILMGQAARVRAVQHFKPEDIWKGYFEIYESL